MRTISPRIFLLVALSAVLLLAGGCGSGGKDKTASYKSDFKAQSVKIKLLGSDVGDSVQGAEKLTDAENAKVFKALATRTHAAAAALLDLSPPESLKVSNAALSTALEKAAGDLDDIVAAAASGDVQGATTATQTLVADSATVQEARNKLIAATK
jgi:predicted phage tail protein